MNKIYMNKINILLAAAAEAERLEAVRKQQKIIDMVSSKDDKGRSELLIKFFDKDDSDFIISQIKSEGFFKSKGFLVKIINQIRSEGFDVNYLAYLSILNSYDTLFALSLAEGADLKSYKFEGKTLIQHIIHAANEAFLKKALSLCSDLSVTAIGAIKQGDLLTIKKLHAHDANFLQNKYKGQTLLQIAISNNYNSQIAISNNSPIEIIQKLISQIAISNNSAIEIIQKLIELDNSLLAGSDESALKLAVISGNDEIIKLIESQTSIEEEIQQLGSDVDAQLKDKILENQDIDTLVRLFKGENISLEQYIEENISLSDEAAWEGFEEAANIRDRSNKMQIASEIELLSLGDEAAWEGLKEAANISNKIQIASEIELLEHSQIKLREHMEQLEMEQLEDELSFEHVNGNTKKRKISDDTSGPSKVRKLESSSVTSQEETYLSEEVIAEIPSFLGPKNLWHVDTGIIPSIEHNTDELALIGSSEIVEA